jgi:hypothetical protein
MTYGVFTMRLILIALISATALAACASAPAPQSSPLKAEAKTEAPKGPQCYNGDADQFLAVGSVAAIAGVNVQCKASADGKSAQWDSAKAM